MIDRERANWETLPYSEGNPVPSFHSDVDEGQTTIPIGSTPEDELLAEAQKPL